MSSWIFIRNIDERFSLCDNSDSRFRAYLDSILNRDDRRVRVALKAGKVLGFLICSVVPNSPIYRTRWIGYINDLWVTHSARRLGVGSALVKDAVSWLKRHGAESIEVYVAHANKAGYQFWRAMGGQNYLQRLSLDLSAFEQRKW